MASKRKGTAAKSCCVDTPYEDSDWAIEDDLRTLARAKAIQADPERMEKCKKMAKKKIDTYKRDKEAAQQMIDMAGE